MKPELMNSLVLAYLGDAYLEILVRDYLVLSLGGVKPKFLQRDSTYYVSAKAQVNFMEEAIKHDWLSQEEINQYKRGFNTKNNRSTKNTDVVTHNKSTGFESIIGYHYVNRNFERIDVIFEYYKQTVLEYKEKKGQI
jgi:Uncharacterized protein conserved in bacteria